MTENLVMSDGNDSELEDKKKDTMTASKKRRVSSGIASIEKEASPHVQKSCFASIVPENMKLVYLRRSLVEEFLKQPENSESKLPETFAGVKNDARLRLTNSPKNARSCREVHGVTDFHRCKDSHLTL
ncbi:hypothetical protein ACFX2I_044359 [Malus domestica]